MAAARPNTRLATHWIFAAALIAGATFWPASHIITHGPIFAVWKTAGVALLAIWVALRARNSWGWLLAAVMLWGAIGDFTLEMSETIGGAAFLIGHVLAFALYRSRPRRGWGAIGVVAMAAAMATAWLLTHKPTILIYAAGLGGMLGSTIASRFPRGTVLLGAAFFAASDLLIFAKMDVLVTSIVPALLIWPLYFAGQALVAYGASTFLEREPR